MKYNVDETKSFAKRVLCAVDIVLGLALSGFFFLPSLGALSPRDSRRASPLYIEVS